MKGENDQRGLNHHQSRSRKDYSPADDYYTPAYIFEALGLTFDVDVCAPKDGIPWLPAKSHYHLEMDGLAQEWSGLVWCNPPYSKPKPWIDKWIEHGNGLMLVQFSRSKGFVRLWEESDGVIALPSNLKFVHISGDQRGIFMPVGLFAIGDVSYQALLRSNLGKVR